MLKRCVQIKRMTIVSALLTAFLSGVVAAYVTYRLNLNKEHVLFMRQKAEELYLATTSFGTDLASTYGAIYVPLFENRIDYNTALDLQVEASKRRDESNWKKMIMITRIYFPTLGDHLDVILKCRDKITDIIARHKIDYRAGNARDEKWLQPLRNALIETSQASERFESAIAEEARNFASESPMIMPELWRARLAKLSVL